MSAFGGKADVRIPRAILYSNVCFVPKADMNGLDNKSNTAIEYRQLKIETSLKRIQRRANYKFCTVTIESVRV